MKALLALFSLLFAAVSASSVAVSYTRASSAPLRYSSASTSVSSVVSPSSSSASPSSAMYYVLPPLSGSSLSGVSSFAREMPLAKQAFQSGAVVYSTVLDSLPASALAQSLSLPLVSADSASALPLPASGFPLSAVVAVGESVSPAALDASIEAMLGAPNPPDAVYLLSAAGGEGGEQGLSRRLAATATTGAYIKYTNYYVKMTPNILAGVLFMFLFTFVVLTAFLCMNDIEGQTYFVKRLPVVGKEY